MRKLLSTVALASVLSLMAPVGVSAATISPAVSSSAVSSPASVVSVPSFASIPLAMSKAKTKWNTKLSSNTLNGKTKYYAKDKTIKVQGKTTKGSAKRTVNLQRYNSSTKKWSNYRTTKVSSSGAFSFTLPKSTTSVSLRFSIPATKTHKSYTSPKTSIQRTKPSSVALIDPALHARTVPWQQNKVSGWVDVGQKQKAKVSLQELRPGGSWKTVSTKSNVSRGGVTFNLPKGNTSANDMKIQYRVSVADTKVTKGKASRAVTVQWDNPYNGNKMERDAYNYIKDKCPNTAVIISSKINDGSAASGTAQMGKNTITIGTNTIPYYLETLALHECAHLKQWDLYKSNWTAFENKMNSIHGTLRKLGMEQNAHCISHQWKEASFWAYGTDEQLCTTGETGKAARAIANGNKY